MDDDTLVALYTTGILYHGHLHLLSGTRFAGDVGLWVCMSGLGSVCGNAVGHEDDYFFGFLALEGNISAT